jgi:lipopolysaccharide transport system ATP-binding protein
VQPGEVVGIIGRNGAGKSTLLKVLSRVTEPTRGSARIRGRVASLLEVGTGFHPELTGRENIFLNGAILGMSRAEIRAKFDEIVEFAEIGKFLDTPVKRYSSGMYVRLAFAVAAHLEPEVLIVDEVLAVGDAQFQKKCLGKMQEVSETGGRTVLFVSHNMGAVRELCSRALLLEGGRVKQDGPSSKVVDEYFATVSVADDIDLSRALHHGPGKWSRLHKLQLLNREGQGVTSVLMGEPLVARILVEILQPTTQVEVGLKISSRYGVGIHYYTSTWEGVSPDLDPGLYWFETVIPSVYLYPGTYLLGVWVSRPGGTSDTNVQEVGAFHVVHTNFTARPNRIEEYVVSGSEVYAPSHWTFAPAQPSREKLCAD